MKDRCNRMISNNTLERVVSLSEEVDVSLLYRENTNDDEDDKITWIPEPPQEPGDPHHHKRRNFLTTFLLILNTLCLLATVGGIFYVLKTDSSGSGKEEKAMKITSLNDSSWITKMVEDLRNEVKNLTEDSRERVLEHVDLIGTIQALNGSSISESMAQEQEMKALKAEVVAELTSEFRKEIKRLENQTNQSLQLSISWLENQILSLKNETRSEDVILEEQIDNLAELLKAEMEAITDKNITLDDLNESLDDHMESTSKRLTDLHDNITSLISRISHERTRLQDLILDQYLDQFKQEMRSSIGNQSETIRSLNDNLSMAQVKNDMMAQKIKDLESQGHRS